MKRPYDSRRWRRIRSEQLAREPFCRICAAASIATPASDVDHIVPIAASGSFDDFSNLQSLCHEHHSQKTRAAQNKQPFKPKLKGVDPKTGVPFDSWWRK